MKRAFLPLFACILLLTTGLKAQYNDGPSTAERFPTIPPFKLIALDSSTFTRDNLAKHKKTMIMYFSPDCEHCQHQTEAMISGMDKLKGIQILMTSYQPFEEMVAFYKKYQLKNFPDIKMARDAQFFFVPFFKIVDMPYMALYSEKGELIKTFEGNTSPEKIAAAFEKKPKKKG